MASIIKNLLRFGYIFVLSVLLLVFHLLYKVKQVVTWLFKGFKKAINNAFKITSFEEKPVGLKNSSAECISNTNSKIDENSQKLESLIKNVGWKKLAQKDSYELLSTIINCIEKEIKNHPNSNQILLRIFVYLLSVLLLVFHLFYKVKQVVTWLFKGFKKAKNDAFKITPFEEKPVGLKNSSAECYMNSIIQALAACDTFIKELKKLKVVLQKSDTNLDSLIDLLISINNPNSKIDENSQKLESLIKNVGWKKFAQQDSYELLSTIINCIEKEIKNHPNSNQFTMPLKMKVLHSFQGVNIGSRIQNYLGLSLGLSGNYSNNPGVSLKDLINEHFAPVIIDDDPGKSSQIVLFKEIPAILLLHIQANKWDNQKEKMTKPEYNIQYDIGFCVKLSVTDDKIKEPEKYYVNYQLCAIVHHMGDISGGHYISYRKWRNNWYLVNDEQVSKYDFKCEVCPYILIYEKM